MGVGISMSYVHGAYLMSPHMTRPSNQVNKNSFGRLINSYYGKHSLFKKTLACSNSSSLLELNEDTKALQASATKLKQEADLYKAENQKQLEGTIKEFVKEYNQVVKSFAEIESKELCQKGNIIRENVKTKKEALADIGIQCEEDGTLTIGESGLDCTDIEAIKEVLQGERGFASYVGKKAETIGKEALSLLAPAPKFYGGSGSIQYLIHSGTLFSTCC